MDGDSDLSPKAPLLGASLNGSGGKRGRLSRRYSVNSLRSEFISRLPDKLRSHLQDVESPYEIDLSKSSGFSRGLFCSSFSFIGLNLFRFHSVQFLFGCWEIGDDRWGELLLCFIVNCFFSFSDCCIVRPCRDSVLYPLYTRMKFDLT